MVSPAPVGDGGNLADRSLPDPGNAGQRDLSSEALREGRWRRNQAADFTSGAPWRWPARARMHQPTGENGTIPEDYPTDILMFLLVR